jgi:tetratricopeptide (TPR) repeat protein
MDEALLSITRYFCPPLVVRESKRAIMLQMLRRLLNLSICLLPGLQFVAAQAAPNRIAPSQAAPNQAGAITSALRAGQFDQAIQLAQNELKQNPNDAQLWTLDGIALSGKGDKKAAQAAFRHALANSPDYLPALEGAAQIEYASGSTDAVPLLKHILQLHPDDQTTHAMLAVMAYRHGECKAAVADFEGAGTALDSQPKALQQYGDCLIRLKETEKAIGVLNRGLSIASNDAGVRRQLAAAQVAAHHPKDAIATLQPLLQQEPVGADVLDQTASAYEADGNTPEAIRLLRQAIVTDPRNPDLYVDFANVAIDHQSYQVGVDMMNAGLALEPKAAPLYVARGILYVQLAQYDNAESDFEKADSLDPTRSMGSAAEGLAAVQENDPDRALATVQAKLAKTPNDAFLLYLRAQILTQRGPDPGTAEFRQAMESAKKAITLRPSLAAARDILAKLYIQAGENEAAIAQCHKALISDPKDQTALYHLIQAQRKSGRTSDIPDLLKQLAQMRADSTKEEQEHYRYKLVEEKSATENQKP